MWEWSIFLKIIICLLARLFICFCIEKVLSSVCVGCLWVLFLVLMILVLMCWVRKWCVLGVGWCIMIILIFMARMLFIVFSRVFFFFIEEEEVEKLIIFVERCFLVSLKEMWVWVEFLKKRFVMVIFCREGIFLIGWLMIFLKFLVVLKISWIFFVVRYLIFNICLVFSCCIVVIWYN